MQQKIPLRSRISREDEHFVSLYRYAEHTAFNNVVLYSPLYTNSRLQIPAVPILEEFESLVDSDTPSSFSSTPTTPQSPSSSSTKESPLSTENLCGLRTVYFVNCASQVNVSVLKRLGYYAITKTVTSIDLSGSTFLTDDGVLALNALPNLTQLSLQNCPKITDYSVASLLEKKTTLRSLFLVSCEQLTNNIVLAISRWGVSLEVLALSNAYRKLDSDREKDYERKDKRGEIRHKTHSENVCRVQTSINDKYILLLHRCSKLHSIAFQNIPVSDNSMIKLIKHLHLRALSLDGCQLNGTNTSLTDATIRTLARYAPNLLVSIFIFFLFTQTCARFSNEFVCSSLYSLF
jgi:hypothetical protein